MGEEKHEGEDVGAVVGRKQHAYGLRTIAAFEASKGVLVLVVGMGLLGFVHRDMQAFAETLVRHLHLSPSSRYPRVFLALTGRVTDAWLWALAGGSALYAGLRFVEAFGLWQNRRWAKWLGAVSAGIYVPFEIVGIVEKADLLRLASLLLNLVVVVYLLDALRTRARPLARPEAGR